MQATIDNLWKSSRPVNGTLGRAYAERLGCTFNADWVRFNLAMQASGAQKGKAYPALLFGFWSADRLVGIEKHFLDPDDGHLVGTEFVGMQGLGCWFTRPPVTDPLETGFGTVCLTLNVERALEIERETGLVCAAVKDFCSARLLVFPSPLFCLAIDTNDMDAGVFANIEIGIRGRAYTVERLEDVLVTDFQPSGNLAA